MTSAAKMPCVSPEELFELVEPHRAAGELVTKHVDRCLSDRCHWVGFYEFRGSPVVVVTPFRLGSRKSEELGLPRKVPGRAWLGNKVPKGTWFGCNHHIAQEL